MTTIADGAPVRRGRGRPRDPGTDARITKSAAELMLQRGFDRTTVDDVAALAISRFVMLADRLAAYAGAVRARLTLEPAEVASAAGTPARSGTAAAPGSGDTPPEVIRQIKLAQFAARHALEGAQVKSLPSLYAS